MTGAGGRGAYRAAFAALAALSAVAIFRPESLWLVDLPQHEALVSILRRWHDPACSYPGLFEIRPLTPYWLGYGLAWALSFPFGVAAAWKIVLAAVVIAIPAATAALVRELGGDERWALLVFPFGFGFATAWGFVSFLVVVPLVVVFLRLAFRAFASPDAGPALRAALFAALLPLAHVLGWLLAVALWGALALATALDRRDGLGAALRRAAPIALSFPLPLAWWWSSSATDSAEQGKVRFLVGLDRLTDLPYQLTGIADRGLAVAAVAAVVAALFAAGARPARSYTRQAPFALVAALVLIGPNLFFGTAYLAPRFAILLLPALLVALERRDGAPLTRPRLAALVLVPAILLGAVAVRFERFAREGAGLTDLLAAAPVGERLLYLPFERGSRDSPDPVFLHAGNRYLLAGCGVAEKSFARHFQLPVRYREGQAPPLPRLVELTPRLFRWEKHDGAGYGLFLIRSEAEPDAASLAGAPGRIALVAHRGAWWLYENVAADG